MYKKNIRKANTNQYGYFEYFSQKTTHVLWKTQSLFIIMTFFLEKAFLQTRVLGHSDLSV